MQKKVLKSRLDFEVAKHASDAFDVNDVISNLDKENITLDEENLTFSGIEEEVNRIRTAKSNLFNTGTKSHGMGEQRPDGYKTETKKLSLEDALTAGFNQKIIN